MVSPPTREQLAAARDRTIPDVLGPGLAVLFCGINPSLYSAFTGHHFARPGNRFWPALHLSGFTPRLLRPAEQDLLPGFGLGVTNLVARATARADEVSRDELTEGGERLRALVDSYQPATVAIVGVTAYRVAFDDREAVIGPQCAGLGTAALWVLPNPSGLNAHYQLNDLAAEFRALRERVR
ncbi:G/U mismatch-specific DNA glycosylase [Actinokineospora sp. HUAS TT18]|uniref:G/U mismatch-specific DNA glycosylase n=1 Tax=Actinokineospora sp. HUAS TT18 TaxID=3447451 RepID=UPI003F51C472